jgi:hypothetical protein
MEEPTERKTYPDDPEFDAVMARAERLCGHIPDEVRALMENRRIEWRAQLAKLRASKGDPA